MLKDCPFPLLLHLIISYSGMSSNCGGNNIDVALDWLACFPTSARLHVYDVFFTNGQLTEVIQALVPCLQGRVLVTHDLNAVCSNAER